MHRITKCISILSLIISTSLIAQSVGDYRTRNSGDWSNAQIWERFNGTSWVAIGTPPTGSETIAVLSDDSVFVNVLVTITDTLINQGIIEAIDSLTITIADGGAYQHDRDEGSVPLCVWEEGSTMLLTGVISAGPEDRNQNYYNLTFNTPDLSANLNMDMIDNIIGGDVRVINTGTWARWYLSSTDPNDTAIVTIKGDVFVEDGKFAVHGTGNGYTTFIVHHYGNIEVTGGNFSISRGSQPNGTTTWYLYEGNFSMSNATTQNSTVTPNGAKFVFAKADTQILTLGEGNTLTNLPIEVSSGTILDMGSSVLEGNGIFILNQEATLATTHTGGIAGTLQCEGNITLSDNASYIFNGTAAQVTSALMPDTVNGLTIDNEAGVALSQETTINGVLRLMEGVFDNTIPFTLGPNGSISYEGGSLLITSIFEQSSEIPTEFTLFQNYPNPFNPSTTIRFDLPSVSDVTVKVFNIHGQEVAMLFEGRKSAGVHELVFDATDLSSGIYLSRIQAGDIVRVQRMVLLK